MRDARSCALTASPTLAMRSPGTVRRVRRGPRSRLRGKGVPCRCGRGFRGRGQGQARGQHRPGQRDC
eukprot:15465563-Alexandrium_andersonii.AAC.1